MKHPGPEVGQLAGLGERQAAKAARLRNDLRVRRQDAIHVGPDLDALGA